MTELSGNNLENNQDDFDKGIVSRENIDLPFNKLANPAATKSMDLIIGEFDKLAKDSKVKITEGKCRYGGFVEKIIEDSPIEDPSIESSSSENDMFEWGSGLNLDNKPKNVFSGKEPKKVKQINEIKINHSSISCILTTNIPVSASSSDVYKILITNDDVVSVHEAAAYSSNTLYSNKQEGSKAKKATVAEQVKFLQEEAIKHGLIKEQPATNKLTVVDEHEKRLKDFFEYVDEQVVSTLKCLTSDSKVEISAREARFGLDENGVKNHFEISVIIDTNIVNPTRDGNYTLKANNSGAVILYKGVTYNPANEVMAAKVGDGTTYVDMPTIADLVNELGEKAIAQKMLTKLPKCEEKAKPKYSQQSNCA